MLLQARVARQQAEGRMLLLVVLEVIRVVGRQLRDVVQAANVARLDSGLLPQRLIERVLPADLHRLEEALVLQRPDALRRPLVDRLGKDVGHRKALIELLPVERLAVDRQLALHAFFLLASCASSASLTLSSRRSARIAFL